MDKSLVTNLCALVVCLAALVFPDQADLLVSTGLYALSGSVTNWLAIYMLFEKVPFLYGSGVIPNRFEAFKGGIKELVLNQFFTVEKLQAFLEDYESPGSGLDAIDYDLAYQGLMESISESSLGPMLAMVGGSQALEPLREPLKERMRGMVKELLSSGQLTLNPQALREKVEVIVDRRLDELTPQAVKEIIQKMIREHLGWLVVWGGVFGGVIGLVVALLERA